MFHVVNSRLRFLKRPTATQVTVTPAGLMSEARFASPFFEVEATVHFAGTTPSGVAGYRLGFTQLQWIETNRAAYKGLKKRMAGPN